MKEQVPANRTAIVLLLTALFLGGFCFPASAQTGKTSSGQIIGYYAERHATTDFTLKQIAASGAAALLTQVDYAFGRVAHNRCEVPNPDLELKRAFSAADSVSGADDPADATQLRGTFHQLQELKRKYAKLKIVISFGGWANSEGFSDAAQPQNLREFVRSCVDTFIRGNFAPGIHVPGIFDGIDIDWEYPVAGGMIPGRPADTKNLNAMAAEFRRQLDAVRPGLLLTAAIPATQEDYSHYDLRTLARYLNFVNLMAYDMHWNGEKITNFHSALFHDPADPSKPPEDSHFADHAVRDFLRMGVPPRKLVLGVPFYGKGWAGVADVNHGLYQAAKGESKSPPAYRSLKSLPGTADRQFYTKTVSCSVWNDGEFFSYDCPEALKQKKQYIRKLQLGGVMFWELGQDTADAELVRTLAGR